jgi:hypothetical protein
VQSLLIVGGNERYLIELTTQAYLLACEPSGFDTQKSLSKGVPGPFSHSSRNLEHRIVLIQDHSRGDIGGLHILREQSVRSH